MSKDFFKPEDFECDQFVLPREVWLKIVLQANRILRERGQVVYSPGIAEMWNDIRDNQDTYKALLVCIEEIEKKKCEHIYVTAGGPDAVNYFKCCMCGAKLKPTAWEEVWPKKKQSN